MTPTTKDPRPAFAAGRVAERTVRAPRFLCSTTSRAIMPVAMGNRAFIRTWAARHSNLAARLTK